MAKGAIQVKIEGQYDDKDLNRAIRDLNRLKTESGAAKGPLGGMTTALKGMGIAVGAVALGSLVSSVKDFAAEAINMAQESKKTTDRVESIAKSMGVFYTQLGGTTDRLTDYAQELQNATGISDETTKSGQAILLTFGELAKTAGEAGGMFDRATAALLDLSAAGFGDVETNAKSLGKALNDPIKGLTALGRQGITFTEQEKEKVKALVATNQTLEAQNLIMAAVEMQVGGTAKAVANDFDKISAAAADAQEMIGFALVNAINDATDAFGGIDGTTDVINGFGQATSNIITGISILTTAIADLTATLTQAEESGTDFGDIIGTYARVTGLAFPPLMALTGAVEGLATEGEKLNETEKRKADEIAGLNALYAGYKQNVDIATSATRQAAEESQTAEDALKALKDAVGALDDKMSNIASREDYRRYLRDLEGDLEKVKNKTLGLGPASDEARDAIIDAFAKASEAATDWAERTGATPEQLSDKFATEGRKIVQRFVDAGFKRSDVKKFLKDQGLWVSELSSIGDYAKAAGVNIGKDLISGIKGALSDPNNLATLRYAGMQAALAAEEGARSPKGADTNSPSKKWAKLGGDLISGLIVGIGSKKSDLKAEAESVMGSILDKAGEIVGKWDAQLEDLQGNLDNASQAVTDWAANASKSLQSAFDLGSIFEESVDKDGNLVASKFKQGVEAGLAQFEWYTNILKKIQAAPGGDQLAAFLQSQGMEKGAVWGQFLIDKGLVQYMIDNLQTVTDTSDSTAQAMVPSFLTSAQQSAQALYDQFAADYGKDGPLRAKLEKLMDRLSSAMNRTATITVNTVYKAAGVNMENPGFRANGGPVSSGKAYVVGERGPELFVPTSSGTIIPNGDLPMASGGVRGGDGAALGGGNSYSITVQAGVGDPRAIGQSVVEYIKKFEAANGNVFAAA